MTTSPPARPIVAAYLHALETADVDDVAELDHDGLIRSLRIVYDTVDVRPAFEQSKGLPSHRS